MQDNLAGMLWQDEKGYHFAYDSSYLQLAAAKANQRLLPIGAVSFFAKTLFPFFDGLIPEGWLLDIAGQTWKLNPRDRMGLLLACCRDCIGAVSILPVSENPAP